MSENHVPHHVSVIMDGNGRWALQRGLARRQGHTEGAESVRVIVRECARLGLEQLTLYAFSSENWKRPKTETHFLMRLLRDYLISEREELQNKNIRLKAIGDLSALPKRTRTTLDETIRVSATNTGMILRLALNYGSRQEIVDAARLIIKAASEDTTITAETITEETFRRFFYDQEMTDPDLLIRTGGETRLSNFLLWQLSYAELWFTKTCWPEFRVSHLKQAFRAYAGRERRYGGLARAPRRQGGFQAALRQEENV